MKLSELRALVRGEVDRVVAERTIASREPPRKMTTPQVADRDKIGKKIKARPGAMKHFRDKYGADAESYMWASATNKAIGDHVEPADGDVLPEVIRLRDISPIFTDKRLKEDWNAGNFVEGEEDGQELDGEHIKAQLMRMNKQSAALYNMLGDVDESEEWVAAKISRASEFLNSVYNHIEYEKKKPEALGNGEGTAADAAGV